ncbi:uncharacterized protein V1516DRAFT_645090 [Lipomyces oligophaga]|uniref:uncharacterized protein n=1 Tax=Lipomyces oligophaga TaxID=45792 RepID=UPI0034CD5B39
MAAVDETIAYLVEQIALDGVEGTTLDRLWSFASQKVSLLDESLKNLFWRWLCTTEGQILVRTVSDGGQPAEISSENDLLDLAKLREKYSDNIVVFATEDLIWQTLTGTLKQDSSVPEYPFALLCVITRSRETGITTFEVAKATNQDPRSMSSRVNLLISLGLVRRYPVVFNGIRTTLLVNARFLQSKQLSNEKEPSHEAYMAVDAPRLRQDILNKLKSSKNNIRHRRDLLKELNLTTGYERKSFTRSLNVLEKLGCIRRVRVIRKSENTDRSYSCIQLIKDFAGKIKDEAVEDLVSFEGDEYADQDDAFKDSIPISQADNSADMSGFEFHEEDLINEDEPSGLSLNRYQPFETQIYNIIAASGQKGLSSVDIYREMLGGQFKRPFDTAASKTTEPASSIKPNRIQPQNLGHYGLVRLSDNSAKVSFIRYFTVPSYYDFIGKEKDPQWGAFSSIDSKGCSPTLDALLKGIDRIIIKQAPLIMKDGKIYKGSRIGSLKPTDSKTEGRIERRGRPTKAQVAARVKAANEAAKAAFLANQQPEPGSSKESENLKLTEFKKRNNGVESVAENSISSGSRSEIITETSEIQTQDMPSIAALARQKLVLSILEENHGVMEGGGWLLQRVRELQVHASGACDRRTLERDIYALIAKKQLHRICISTPTKSGTSLTKWICMAPEITVDSPAVERLKAKLLTVPEKRKITLRSLDVISDDFSLYQLESLHRKSDFKKIQRRAERAMLSVSLDEEQAKAASERLQKRMEDREGSLLGSTRTSSSVLPKSTSATSPSSKMDGRSWTNRILGSAAIAVSAAARSITGSSRRVLSETIAKDLISNEESDSVPVDETNSIGKVSRKGRKRSMAENMRDPIIDFVRPGKKLRSSEASGSKKQQLDEVNNGHHVTSRVRFQLNLQPTDVDRLFRTVIIIRSFYGGAARSIDWTRVADVLGNPFTPKAAHSGWTRARKILGGNEAVLRSSARWEAIFLAAYERGEFGDLDLDKLDIPALVGFWKDNESNLVDSYVDEDTTNAELITENETRVFIRNSASHSWLDEVNNPISSIKVIEALTETPFICDVKGSDEAFKTQKLVSEGELDKVRQLIKAIISTEEARYDAQLAKELLEKFGVDPCSRAVSDLEHDRSVTYVSRDLEHRLPGRNFIFSDRFNSMARLRPDERILEKARDYQKILTSAFAEQKGVKMQRIAPDSSMVCILNMIGGESIELVRVDVKSGNLIEGYSSRLVDREKLDCDIVFKAPSKKKTELCLEKVAIPVEYDREMNVIPGCRSWVDITGEVSKIIYRRFTDVILMALSLRPGTPFSELQRRFASILTSTELSDILDWLVEKKLVECQTAKGYGYWVCGDWYCNDIGRS